MPNTTAKDAWDSGRPILDRLPAYGYRDNPIVDWLTTWADGDLSAVKDIAETFYQTLDPDLCPEDRLDYLAWFHELTGSFWDVNWTPAVKREMIKTARAYLWKNRGTLGVISRVLDIHSIPYKVWVPRSLLLRFPLGPTAIFGGGALKWYVQLPITVRRNSLTWKEAERTVRNFGPAITKHAVCYERFYLGFSLLGDPLFKKSTKPRPPLYYWDSFEGYTGPIASKVPDIRPPGLSYLYGQASWTISGGKLTMASPSGELGLPVNTADIDITFRLQVPAGGSFILFRRNLSPAADIRVALVPGFNVYVATYPGANIPVISTTPITAQTYTARVLLKGQNIQIWINGTPAVNYTGSLIANTGSGAVHLFGLGTVVEDIKAYLT